jgi:hypothetical protein
MRRDLIERGGPSKADPRRDPSLPPAREPMSTHEEIALIKGRGWRVAVPASLVSALAAALVAWAAKPSASLPEADQRAIRECVAAVARLEQGQRDGTAELRNFRQWAEPQIQLLVMRSGASVPPPPPGH